MRFYWRKNGAKERGLPFPNPPPVTKWKRLHPSNAPLLKP